MRTQEQMIKAALGYAGMSQADLARALGLSRSNLNGRLLRGSLSEEELEQIAKVLGADFFPAQFVFPDGFTV